MLVGHFAVAFLGKRIEPRISLGTLMLAAMLADILWCAFMIAGIEEIRARQGATVAGLRMVDAMEATQIAFSHSLVMLIVWSAVAGCLFFLRSRNRRAAWIISAIVISHWFLDFASHPPDMPLAPFFSQRLGLGLWNSIPATIVIEGFVWVFAIQLYVRSTRSENRVGVFVLWAGIVLLTLIWFANIAGPPPRDFSDIGYSSLTLFGITVGWAYRVNRWRGRRLSERPRRDGRAAAVN